MLNKNHIFDSLVEAVSKMIVDAKVGMDDAQKEANFHVGAMASRYDTFKEEAQYLAAGFQKKMLELVSDKVQIKLLYQKEQERKIPHQKVGLGTLIHVVHDDDKEDLFFMSPALGGHQIELAENRITVITPSSPLGNSLMNKQVNDSATIGIAQKKRTLTIIGIF